MLGVAHTNGQCNYCLGLLYLASWASPGRHIVAQRAPALLGECRPVVPAELLDAKCSAVHTDTTVTTSGFPAGVLVAEVRSEGSG